MKRILRGAFLALGLLCGPAVSAPADAFKPGEVWRDTDGRVINAHGGGLIKVGKLYYWFGEHKTEGDAGNRAQVGVHVYSSADLLNWTDRGIALAATDDPMSDIVKGSVIERPKVIYEPKSKTYVMWFHLELKGLGYKSARAAVATSKTVTGPYAYRQSFRLDAGAWPVNIDPKDKDPSRTVAARDFETGQMSRDMTLFVDDDGHAYQIAASEENHTMHISQLRPDFQRENGLYAQVMPHGDDEAPAIFKHAGKYYLITSGLTGWAPNAAKSYIADRVFGPWKALGNPVRGGPEAQSTTFGGQSTFVLTIRRKGCERQILMLDMWRPSNPIDGRYAWLPIEWYEGRPIVRWRDSWTLADMDNLPCS